MSNDVNHLKASQPLNAMAWHTETVRLHLRCTLQSDRGSGHVLLKSQRLWWTQYDSILLWQCLEMQGILNGPDMLWTFMGTHREI